MRRMKWKTSSRSRRESGIDMTPLIDIVFILLIFFVLTANFSSQPTVTIDRPTARQGEPGQKEAKIVTVDARGMIWWQERHVSLDELFSIVRSQAKDSQTSVVVHADQQVSTGLLIQVIDQIRLAGVAHVAVATEPK